MVNPPAGRLVLVPTPLGNLADITLRALETLKACDLIACEDTRHTRVLLTHHGISRPLLSVHEHNEASRIPEILDRIRQGQTVSLVSDAGTPCIADPGERLVAACRLHGLPVESLPGPCAVPTPLAASGFPSSAFHFGGFLPVKKGRRESTLREALDRADTTSVFYESPHRLDGTLEMLATLAPGRLICVARELTKHFEEYQRGPAAEVAAHFTRHPAKGEIVLILSPADLPKHCLRPSGSPGGPDSES